MNRAQLPEREPSGVAPLEELGNGPCVGFAGVGIPDVRREELDEVPAGLRSGLKDDSRERPGSEGWSQCVQV